MNLRSRTAGFSLVEALVALLVLSVGMLGIAALYVESLRASRSALARTQAVILAADMVNRISANRGGEDNYKKGADDKGSWDETCVNGGGCDAAAMAKHDIAVWYEELDPRAGAITALPGGRGQITVDKTTTPTTYLIQVSWAEIGQEADSSYTLRARL